MSLDAFRAINKEDAATAFLEDIQKCLGQIKTPELIQSQIKIQHHVQKLQNHFHSNAQMGDEEQQAGARRLAFALTHIYAASLLLEHAQWASLKNKDTLTTSTVIRWCEKNPPELIYFSEEHKQASQILAMGY